MNYTISNELSDHSGICDCETLISKPVFREIRRTDYARMNSLLISDLYYSEAPTVMNVSERIGYMMSVIKSRLVERVREGMEKKCIWINQEVKRLCKTKKRLLKKLNL